MRRGIALALLLALVPSAQAASQLEFALPATVSSAVAGEGADWFLLVFRGGVRGNLSVGGLVQDHVVETDRRVYHDGETGYQVGTPRYDRPSDDEFEVGAAGLSAPGLSSVFVRAQSVRFGLDGSLGLVGADPGQDINYFTTNEEELEVAAEYHKVFPSRTLLLGDGGGAARVWASGVSSVYLHNVRLDCGGCPDGRDRTESSTPLPTGRLDVKRLRFHELSMPGGSLDLQGDYSFLALGGPWLDLTVDGSVRLPLAQGQGCDDCLAPQGQTLAATGHVTLDGFRALGPARGSAAVGGDLLAARFDEAAVDPRLLAGSAVAATAAGVALVALAKLLLAPLFTRMSKEQALAHPNRQRIFQYVQDHPGANFREISRRTGIPAGTVRHHLTVLQRAGHLVEHQHQGTVRLFENHGKYDRTWADVVLLREPPLARLHEWLVDNPGSPQKDVLAAMEAEGWSRSTTQHRLVRLVDGGLAAIRLHGRMKLYSAAERAASPVQVQPFVLAR